MQPTQAPQRPAAPEGGEYRPSCPHRGLVVVVVVAAEKDRSYAVCRECADSSPLLEDPGQALAAFRAGLTHKRPDGLDFERGRRRGRESE